MSFPGFLLGTISTALALTLATTLPLLFTCNSSVVLSTWITLGLILLAVAGFAVTARRRWVLVTISAVTLAWVLSALLATPTMLWAAARMARRCRAEVTVGFATGIHVGDSLWPAAIWLAGIALLTLIVGVPARRGVQLSQKRRAAARSTNTHTG